MSESNPRFWWQNYPNLPEYKISNLELEEHILLHFHPATLASRGIPYYDFDLARMKGYTFTKLGPFLHDVLEDSEASFGDYVRNDTRSEYFCDNEIELIVMSVRCAVDMGLTNLDMREFDRYGNISEMTFDPIRDRSLHFGACTYENCSEVKNGQII